MSVTMVGTGCKAKRGMLAVIALERGYTTVSMESTRVKYYRIGRVTLVSKTGLVLGIDLKNGPRMCGPYLECFTMPAMQDEAYTDQEFATIDDVKMFARPLRKETVKA